MHRRQLSDLDRGWSYVDAPERDAAAGWSDADDISVIFARCFLTNDGASALKHLRNITVERIISPSAPESMLRHAEGQRHLVKTIETLITRGSRPRAGATADPS